MAVPFRYAFCNELFGKMPLGEAFKQARELGYEGVEIAPFTLSDDPVALSTEKRHEIRRSIKAAHLEFVGLHWLLVTPEGLSIASRDKAVRKRTWEYIHGLIDLCADLAGCNEADNGILVFGSPKQRAAVEGVTPREATDLFIHDLAHAAPHAESRGVKILVEALPANQTNVLTCLADAISVVKQIGSPAIQTMFDTHNAVDEKEEHASLVQRYYSHIKHVHVNETDGREPGMGDYDFQSLLQTLTDLNYKCWVSVEVFDFSRNATDVARRAIEHLRASEPGRDGSRPQQI